MHPKPWLSQQWGDPLSPSATRASLGRVAWILACAVLWCACQKNAVPGAIAHLEQLVPDVVVRAVNTETDKPAQELMGLVAGDVVKTQAQGEVDVVFSGNNRIHLGPNASLLIEQQGSANAELGAVILSGNVRVTAGGVGVGLDIRSPVGKARLSGAQVSVMDVSMDGGLEVKLGEVALEQPQDQKVVHLEVGQAVTMASAGSAGGLVISSLAPEADVAPMTFDISEPPYAQIDRLQGPSRWQHHGQGQWVALNSGLKVGNGDRVRTEADAHATIALTRRARVQLLGDNDLQLLRTDRDKQQETFHYRLPKGEARLLAERGGVKVRQQVEFAGAQATLDVGPQRADVAVTQNNNETRLLVRFGSITLPSGQQVRGGQAATLVGGALKGPPTEGFDGVIPLSNRKSSVVYFNETVPPVRFVAENSNSNTDVVRFGKDRRVKRHVIEERLTSGAFASDAVVAGSTFWKVGTKGRPARLDVVREPHRATVGGRTSSAILDDTGESTTLFFGNAVPSLELHWAKQDRAEHYRVAVFQKGYNQKPLIEAQTRLTRFVVPRGRLREGQFVWRVSAMGENAQPLSSVQDNGLTIVHEAEVHGLALRTPAGDAHTSDPSLLAQGDIEPGCALSINGIPVTIDRKWHFSHPLPLRPGENHFIFRLTRKHRPDRFYVRVITRDT